MSSYTPSTRTEHHSFYSAHLIARGKNDQFYQSPGQWVKADNRNEFLTGGSDSEEPAFNARDLDSIPRLGGSPSGVHGNPLHYSRLGRPHGQRFLAGYSPRGRRVGHDWMPKHTTAQLNNQDAGWGKKRDKKDILIIRFWILQMEI